MTFLPAIAGEFENAQKTHENVFLYLYTPECGYCNKFNPRYQKLSNMYKNHYGFVKLNASSGEGHILSRKFNVHYVPFVVLYNAESKKAWQVQTNCLMDLACTEKALKDFKK